MSSLTLNYSVYAVARYDPTRTLILRNAFAREMRVKFRRLSSIVSDAIINGGILGVEGQRSADRITTFMSWLDRRSDPIILGMEGGTAWINKYSVMAYQRGIMRGRQELRNAGYDVPTVESMGGVVPVSTNNPFHADRMRLLYIRLYNDLRGIIDTMEQQIGRVVAQSLIDGLSRRETARLISKIIKGPASGLSDVLGRFTPAMRRADILARTEIIRAYHTATIQEYRNWAVKTVKIMAEWSTAKDAAVCELCEPLDGRIFDLERIESMIPVHPQCRCVAIPIAVAA